MQIMKKFITLIFLTIFSLNTSAENLENKTMSELIKEGYKILYEEAPTPNEENIYVFLQKGIAERGFMKSYEIIICKIPGKNFNEKTTCKIP